MTKFAKNAKNVTFVTKQQYFSTIVMRYRIEQNMSQSHNTNLPDNSLMHSLRSEASRFAFSSPHPNRAPSLRPGEEITEHYHLSTLDNGVRLVTAPERESGFLSSLTSLLLESSGVEPVVELRITVKAGALNDPENKEGLAHFLEHMMFAGESADKRQELYMRLDQAEFINAYTTDDHTCYIMKVRKSKLDQVLAVFADATKHALIDDERIPAEANVIQSEIDMALDSNVRERLLHIIRHMMSDATPYPNTIGSLESVRSITGDDLRQFHQDHYHAGNIIVSAKGISHTELQNIAQSHFGTLSSGTENSHPHYRFAAREEKIEFPSRQGFVQALFPFVSTHDSDLPTTLLALYALCGTFGRRLFGTMREEGTAYSKQIYSLESIDDHHAIPIIELPSSPDFMVRNAEILIAELEQMVGDLENQELGILKEKILPEAFEERFLKFLEKRFSSNNPHTMAQQLLLHGEYIAAPSQSELIKGLRAIKAEDVIDRMVDMLAGDVTLLGFGPVEKAEELAGTTLEEAFFQPFRELQARMRTLKAERDAVHANTPWFERRIERGGRRFERAAHALGNVFALYDNDDIIINTLIGEITPTTQEGHTPTFVGVFGLPGEGRSTWVDKISNALSGNITGINRHRIRLDSFLEENNSRNTLLTAPDDAAPFADAVHISSDRIVDMLTDHKHYSRRTQGEMRSLAKQVDAIFKKFGIETPLDKQALLGAVANQLATQALQTCVERGLNVVFEASPTHLHTPEAQALMHAISNQYDTTLFALSDDPSKMLENLRQTMGVNPYSREAAFILKDMEYKQTAMQPGIQLVQEGRDGQPAVPVYYLHTSWKKGKPDYQLLAKGEGKELQWRPEKEGASTPDVKSLFAQHFRDPESDLSAQIARLTADQDAATQHVATGNKPITDIADLTAEAEAEKQHKGAA